MKITLGIVTLLMLLALLMEAMLFGRVMKTVNTSLFAACWLTLYLIYPHRLKGINRFIPLLFIMAGVALLLYRMKEGKI
jgi:hypothetical protein